MVLLASPSAAGAQGTAPHLDKVATAMGGTAADMTMATFLDRLMIAESGGRDMIANPRSTAVGPFQFIVSTFLSLTARHFASETGALSPVQVLALRTDRPFSRRVAEVYTRENAAALTSAGIQPTWPHLRLAFFAGAEGAARVIRAKPETPVSGLLGSAAMAANPFLAGMTAADLLQRSARDLRQNTGANAALAETGEPLQGPTRTKSKKARIPVRCDLSLPSCRRWLALAERRQLNQITAARKPVRKPDART
jgi:hypothetical protein